MSKINALATTYNKIPQKKFQEFREKVPNIKYLEYVLSVYGSIPYHPRGYSNQLINLVSRFDKVSYKIPIKDIYNPIYKNIYTLEEEVVKAEEEIESQKINLDDHRIIIKETDSYILIYPKTFYAAKKYGNQTKWCITSNASTFNDYKSSNILYLISKTNTVIKNYEKIAIALNDRKSYELSFYLANDARASFQNICHGGWDMDEFFEITQLYRIFVRSLEKITDAKSYITSTLNKINSIDINKLEEKLIYLNKFDEQKDFNEILTKIAEFKIIAENLEKNLKL